MLRYRNTLSIVNFSSVFTNISNNKRNHFASLKPPLVEVHACLDLANRSRPLIADGFSLLNLKLIRYLLRTRMRDKQLQVTSYLFKCKRLKRERQEWIFFFFYKSMTKTLYLFIKSNFINMWYEFDCKSSKVSPRN